MGKFSTYRYLELREDNSVPHINSRSRTIKQPRQLKKAFIALILVVLCVTYVLGFFISQTQWLDGLAKSLGYESEYHHAVIIDAGSSGSRVLAYKFRVPFKVFGQTSLELVDEYFEQSKPGLSDYANAPAEGAQTIVKLIKNAEHMIPAEKRNDTPLLVRATAGLRLLPADTAHRIIEAVQAAISKLGYNTSSNSVQIMEGNDEGVFIWYTVNLLNNLMNSETVAALDLGGGSTQITYQLSAKDEPNYPVEDQYVVQAGSNITLYTHSYLNLGLLAARYGIFKLEADQSKTAVADPKQFVSICVDPIIQEEPWTYANKELRISGAQRPNTKTTNLKLKEVYSRCHSVVKKYVMKTLDWKTKRAPLGKVAAMSFFYDVAADAGLIDVMTGGTVSVTLYRRAAIAACSASNVDQPWACIDLVYIVTLLQDAYKIQDDAPIVLFKKIEGHEVSWALGLAYTTVMNRLAKSES